MLAYVIESSGTSKKKTEDRKALAKEAYEHLTKMCSNLDAFKVVFPSTPEIKDSLVQHCPEKAVEDLVSVGRRFDRNFHKILRIFVETMVENVKGVDVKNFAFGEQDAFHDIQRLVPKDAKWDDEIHIAVRYLMEFNKAFQKLAILHCSDVLEFLKTNENLPFFSQDIDIEADFVRETKKLWDQVCEWRKAYHVNYDMSVWTDWDD